MEQQYKHTAELYLLSQLKIYRCNHSDILIDLLVHNNWRY